MDKPPLSLMVLKKPKSIEENLLYLICKKPTTSNIYLSASSNTTILCRPKGRVTFCWANILILLRTVSMPLSLEAFNSKTASFIDGPRSARAKQRIVVVLPTPGGPWTIEDCILIKFCKHLLLLTTRI